MNAVTQSSRVVSSYKSFTDISNFQLPSGRRPFPIGCLYLCVFSFYGCLLIYSEGFLFSSLAITAAYEHSRVKCSALFLCGIAFCYSFLNNSGLHFYFFACMGARWPSFSPFLAFIFARFLLLLSSIELDSLGLASGNSFMILFTSLVFFSCRSFFQIVSVTPTSSGRHPGPRRERGKD